jgi:hypothetical protein
MVCMFCNLSDEWVLWLSHLKRGISLLELWAWQCTYMEFDKSKTLIMTIKHHRFIRRWRWFCTVSILACRQMFPPPSSSSSFICTLRTKFNPYLSARLNPECKVLSITLAVTS